MEQLKHITQLSEKNNKQVVAISTNKGRLYKGELHSYQKRLFILSDCQELDGISVKDKKGFKYSWVVDCQENVDSMVTMGATAFLLSPEESKKKISSLFRTTKLQSPYEALDYVHYCNSGLNEGKYHALVFKLGEEKVEEILKSISWSDIRKLQKKMSKSEPSLANYMNELIDMEKVQIKLSRD